MTDSPDSREAPSAESDGAPCATAELRLVPPALDVDDAPAPEARLIREFKGHAVPDFGLSRREPEQWLPDDSADSNVVAGPGFGRRRVAFALWPLLGFAAVILASAVWIAIS